MGSTLSTLVLNLLGLLFDFNYYCRGCVVVVAKLPDPLLSRFSNSHGTFKFSSYYDF